MALKIATKKLAELYASHGHSIINNEGIIYDFISYNQKNFEREIISEIKQEMLVDKKKIVREKLDEFRDNSADAIADYYKMSRQMARGLCRGMNRDKHKSHRGNDYDFRGKY